VVIIRTYVLCVNHQNLAGVLPNRYSFALLSKTTNIHWAYPRAVAGWLEAGLPRMGGSSRKPWYAKREKLPPGRQGMEYLIGVMLSLAVVGLATVIGFDRERAFYPVVMIVIASYYVLFAAMGASRRTLIIEIVIASAFLLVAVLGYKKNAWVVVVALIGHGIFDYVHRLFIDNPGVPNWWPGFCLAFDVVFGALLAVRLIRLGQPLERGSTAREESSAL
jgi:hypothetical protein